VPFSLLITNSNFMENFSPLPSTLPELHAVAAVAPAKLRHRLDNTKRKGELSEAAFLLKASSLGFGVAKPWGDSERYDFILDPHDTTQAAPSFPDFGKGGDFALSSRAQSRDLALSVAPPLSRSLRQGGDFDFVRVGTGALARATLSLGGAALQRCDSVPPSRPTRNLSPTKDSAPPRLWRVQLKCTDALRARGYDVQPIYSIYGQGKRVYTANDIDVLVAHIVPLDVWYVLPVGAFSPCKSLRFYPDAPCKRARFEHFREAWHLLR
jgi:hypothetical protein